MESVKINIPESKIKFDISGESFVLDLADKSRNKINESYRHVELEEAKAQQTQQVKGAEFTEKLAQLDAKAEENGMPEPELKKQRYSLQNDFEKRMQHLSEKQDAKSKDDAIKLLDDMFGTGQGQKIYSLCGESTPVLGMVLTSIVTEMQNRTNVIDYAERYRRKIAEMKPDEVQSN